MSNEIERKWVLNSVVKPADLMSFVQDAGMDMLGDFDFDQFYIAKQDNTVRVRIVKDKKKVIDSAVLCFKGKPSSDGLSRLEIEQDISLKDALKLKELSIAGLEKNRVIFKDKETGLCIEFDFYKGKLDGLVTAEVEYPDLESAKKMDVPDVLRLFFKEVTGVREYSNDVLAEKGIPNKNSPSITI